MTDETQDQQAPEPQDLRALWNERISKLREFYAGTEDEYSFGIWSEIVKTYIKAVSEVPPKMPVGSPGMNFAMELIAAAVIESERILVGVANTIPRPPEAPNDGPDKA